MTGNELTSVRLTTNKLFKRVSMQAQVAQRCDALAHVVTNRDSGTSEARDRGKVT